LDISLICWFSIIRFLVCVFGVYIAKEVVGLGDKESGDTTMVDVHTL
jgi:hypothetical protein